MTYSRHKGLKKWVVERAAGPDKSAGNGKRMNDKQAMDSHENGARTRLNDHPLVPSQYKRDGP